MGTLETERDVAPADRVATWTLAEHVCRRCLARVLTRTADDGGTVARCSGCDIEAVGGPEAICFCGALPDKFRVKFQAQHATDYEAERRLVARRRAQHRSRNLCISEGFQRVVLIFLLVRGVALALQGAVADRGGAVARHSATARSTAGLRQIVRCAPDTSMALPPVFCSQQLSQATIPSSRV
jgi:hypothetical protein